MDFFARQERSRRTTRILLVAFLAAVLGTALAVTVFAAVMLRLQDAGGLMSTGAPLPTGAWISAHLPLLTGIAAGTLGVIAVASLVRAATLMRGGAQVARMLGGSEISSASADPLHRRLINVVEEMAIAAGVPVPAVFVLEQEPAINAFAAGLSVSDAAIAVTRGALQRLERAELQGVVAHEFSHIVNGDMRLNQQLIGFAFGILVISLAGRWLIRHHRAWYRRRNSAALVIGLGLTFVGSAGVLFSRIIKAAVSRQREQLADASAVQFTREPLGLAGALKKIGGYTGQLSSVDSEEISHMLFARGAASFRGLFATHPPLLARIQALDPGFTPDEYPTAAAEPLPRESYETETPHSALAPGQSAQIPDDPLARAGQFGAATIGRALRAALPETLYEAAISRESSLLLILALAIDPDPARDAQWQLLRQQIGEQRTQRCRRLHEELRALDRRLYLPLVEIAIPALRQRPAEQLRYLRELLRRLTQAAPQPRLFDHLLLRVLEVYIGDSSQHPPPRGRARMSAQNAALTLLAAVAAHGHTTSRAARAAFLSGAAKLGRVSESLEEGAFESLSDLREPGVLDAALERLAHAAPATKRTVLQAALTTIRHDQAIAVEELELFRAIAATLGTPIPPFASLTEAVI